MSDSCKIMSEELKQIQGRHRQFYRIQLDKVKLDKFEPTSYIKFENNLLNYQKEQKKLRKDQPMGDDEIDKLSIHKNRQLYLKNFCITLLMYKDKNA